jgi:glycerophosphoryl diester phosphodiesterase
MENYPENSLLGLEMALKAGACMVEFDVQMSADHQLVVLHDGNLVRTAGTNKSIFDLTLNELSVISVHEPDRLGEGFYETPVPTLEQVMKLICNYPAAIAFVEIKDESLEYWGLEYIMSELQKSLEPYSSQAVIIAYNMEALTYVKQQGQFATGWVVTAFDESHHEKAKQLRPEYLICNHKKITESDDLWQGDWSWMLYDITDLELALQWAERGAALIETRDIGGMLQHAELRKESCIDES